MTTITETLAEYVMNATYQDFPNAAVEMAKLCILDSIGCTLAGSKTDIGAPVIDLVKDLGGRPESPLLGTEMRTSCTNAAFANAEMANALDFDDTYLWSAHVGSTVVQSALAVGCAEHVSGKDLITAVILGYEVNTRIGPLVLHPKFTSLKTSGHGFVVFGAAAVAAKLHGLDKEQTTWAMGIAGATAPVSSDDKCCINPLNAEIGAPMVKNNYGMAAEMGIRAALLAKRGYTGPIDILEGEKGFPVMLGAHSYNSTDLETIVKDLGGRPRIVENWFKPYPCCLDGHPPIDGALQIMEEHQLNLNEIDEIIVKTVTSKALSLTATDTNPKNIRSAQTSIPYPLAVALLGLEPGSEWQSEATMRRADILELARKVKVRPDPESDALRRGGHDALATVQISSKGKTYEQQVLHSKGTSENPMTKEELTHKFLKCASTTMSPKNAKAVLHLIEELETIRDIEELARSLLAVP